MPFVYRKLIATIGVAGMIAGGQSVSAETELSLAGHWQSEMGLHVDIAKDAAGNYFGTVSQPNQNMNGLLLIEATLEDDQVYIIAREDQPLYGTLSADGQTIDGTLEMMNMQYPVSFTRTGDAVIETATFDAVDPRFVGTWEGIVAGMAVELKVSNHAGRSRVEVVNLFEGGLRIPASSVVAEGTSLTVELAAVSGSFTGDLSSDGNQLQGSFRQPGSQGSMTLTRQGPVVQ